jgi:shikimate dehydrogenase
MHNAEGARLGIGYDYRLFDFDRLGLPDSALKDVVTKARREGYAGLNITYPFKERVVDILDTLSPDASAIGAVNTVVFRDGTAVGHNTDCWGFAESFRMGLEAPRLGDVVLFGAGGAGMAVGRALLELGTSRLHVFDIDSTKSQRLVRSLLAQFDAEQIVQATDVGDAMANAAGLVNATPVGMAKFPGIPIRREWLRSDLWVADVVYFPVETELLGAAKSIGCQTLPGTGMAIFQALKAFELITGVAPDPEQMARHFQAS